MPSVTCKQCSSLFNAKPSWLKKGQGQYCSNNCRYAANRRGRTVDCHHCGTATYKQPKALERSKSGFFFCGKSCQTKWRNLYYSNDKHPNWKGGHASYRALMQQQSDSHRCTLCHTDDIRILAVHHINEDRSNNMIENLAWLCHNCHHLVHHHSDERTKFMAIIV